MKCKHCYTAEITLPSMEGKRCHLSYNCSLKKNDFKKATEIMIEFDRKYEGQEKHSNPSMACFWIDNNDEESCPYFERK